MSVADIRKNRYAILVCGILTMLMFGTIYAWSIFIPPLEAEFGWTRSQTSLVFSVAMIGLSLWIVGEGVTAMKKAAANPDDKKPEKAGKTEKRRWVVIALILCAIYYAALAFIKIPYITIGILSFAYTFSTFEVVTVVFLIAMMVFMGVRKIPVLVFVPIGTTLFLSLAFRTFLHVLLP